LKSSKQYIQTFEKLNVTDPTPWEKYLLKILILLGISSLIFLIIWFIRNVEIGQSFFFWFLIFAMGFRVSRILALWYHYFFLDALQPEKLENKKVTVDVFTTYFPGEPKEMVKNTLLAMKNITYPHENFLCDEANDEELIQFCKNYQIHHITRNNRTNAKAGNVNNALKHAKGEFCFILDPDHVPHPDLLNIVIPHFNKPEIGFVQVVQGYYNIENSLIAKAAAQQTYQFYGPMMMGMNSLGTVQAIGANCCFRRKALDSIGGHAAGLAEDLHTSMLLHANGWKSVYIPQVVTKGLVPEDFHGYFKQQLKWSKGSFDLLFQVFPKICNKLTFQQKIHYLFQPQYYFFGLMTFIEILIPSYHYYSSIYRALEDRYRCIPPYLLSIYSFCYPYPYLCAKLGS
jgi:cellulose synthase (UDP-forming)